MKSSEPNTIRQASADDAVAIHALIAALAESLGDRNRVSATVSDIRAALSGAEPALYAFIAERDEQVLGGATFFLTFSTWRGTRGVYLQDIYVSPAWRGSGGGKKLLASVVSWAAEHGADHLRLSVDHDNPEAQAFYQNAGMSYCDKEMIYQIEDRAFEALRVLS